ncbi:MAG: phosphatidylglycerol lysyltransferase domain-containing protein [Lutibacter sp.]|jgi:phosphatidylglycerol lysyltransferase
MKILVNSIKINKKLILQIAVGLLSVFLGIYFIKHEKAELGEVKIVLIQANKWLLLIGIVLMLLSVVIQGFMYQFSFKAVNKFVSLKIGILLYLKRNFISVFIPAGTVTNMFFFNKEIEEKEGIEKTVILYASTIFYISSIASSILIAIPAIILLFIKRGLKENMIIGIGLALVFIVLIIAIIVSFIRKGIVFQILENKAPSLATILNNLREYPINKIQLFLVLVFSCLIEIIGIAYLYIAMLALNIEPSLMVAIIGYALVLIILLSSPFLRGIGAIELALTYALTLFGYSAVAALSVAFLFRFFEFWSVLLLGLAALIFKKDNLFLRIFPAFLLFILGIVNIISAITPSLPERLKLLSEIIPIAAIHTSIWLVLFSGAFLLAVAVFLIKGLKNAWIIAVILTSISLFGHLTKGIDWEEAIIAFITLCSLLFTHKQYFLKRDASFDKQLWFPAVVSFLTVLIFGTIGFYFIDKNHFGTNFSLWESLEETLTAFFLQNTDLNPYTSFSKIFLFSVHILGALIIAFWLFIFLKPFIRKKIVPAEESKMLAKQLVTNYGKGSLDYFKTYNDKLFWFNTEKTGFVSYKITGNYAIVLENPITKDNDSLEKIIIDFDNYCKINGLRAAYYRVPKSSIEIYENLHKKTLLIGREAVVNLETFTIEGNEKKGIRNAINKLSKSGFLFKINEPPQKESFLQQLKSVSSDWLLDMDRKEMVFSQGLFSVKELKEQTIFTIESNEGKIVGFVNMIPNFMVGEANFDLMRKTTDAPNGTMDFLFVKMFEQLKLNGYLSCNLGMVPLSGIDNPKNILEQAMKTAYEKIKIFSQYKNLYNFKEKYDPTWTETYLVFNEPFDLTFIPSALKKIMED